MTRDTMEGVFSTFVDYISISDSIKIRASERNESCCARTGMHHEEGFNLPMINYVDRLDVSF